MRAKFAPATAHSDSVARPGCSECGTATVLVGIEPDIPGTNYTLFSAPSASTLKLLLGKLRRRRLRLASTFTAIETTVLRGSPGRQRQSR